MLYNLVIVENSVKSNKQKKETNTESNKCINSPFYYIGDIMGPTMDNLDRLVRMPYGCGEQNMISTAPSVFVSEYLKAYTNPDLSLLATAARYISIGMFL